MEYTKEDFKKELEHYDKLIEKNPDNDFNAGFHSALEKCEDLILFDKVLELRLKQLKSQVEILKFMVDNGLGKKDMLNDI